MIEQHVALAGFLVAGKAIQHSTFSASARTEDSHKFIGFDGKADILNERLTAASQGKGGDFDRHSVASGFRPEPLWLNPVNDGRAKLDSITGLRDCRADADSVYERPKPTVMVLHDDPIATAADTGMFTRDRRVKDWHVRC
jgi:hypothetical protein